MSTKTLYNYDNVTPAQETRELYLNVGSSKFQLGDAARGFKGSTDFEIWDSAVGGTQLVEDTDYEILDVDDRLSPNAGFDIYTRIRILNATYQTGNIYMTYKVVLSYVDSAFYNNLYDIATSGGSIKYLVNADSPFTILDDDGYTDFVCDTSGGDIIINDPTLADNPARTIAFNHQVGGGLVTVNGEGGETMDGLASIELPKQGDRLSILGTTLEWAVTEEKISCQFKLNTYAGYGSAQNKIPRLTNLAESYGNMFTENHSTGYNGNTEGLAITIQRAGKYSFTFSPNATPGYFSGLSLNSTQPTTSITGITITDKLIVNYQSNAGTESPLTVSTKCEVGDVVRPHTDGNPAVSTIRYIFHCTYNGN